jgi:O-antigen ligase
VKQGLTGVAADYAKPPRWEWVLAGLTAFLFAEAFLPKLFAGPPAGGATGGVEAESSFLRNLWLPFYALILIGLAAHLKQSLKAMLGSPALILLALLAMVSSLWSIDPGITLRRGVAVTCTGLAGAALASLYDWKSALRLLGCVWVVLLGLSLVSAILAPSFGVMQEVHVGAWAGGWWEKNDLGGHGARASFLFAFLAWRDEGHRRAWIGALLLSLFLVVMSTSVTALLGVMTGIGVLAAAWWSRKGKGHALALGYAAVAGGLLLVFALAIAPQFVFGLIGRDATLTGRTDIWNVLGDRVAARPWLGFGYGAFWAPGSEERYWISRALEWSAPSAHNGWLDLAIGLGAVGVALFAIEFVVATLRAVRLAMASPLGVYALGVLAQMLMFSMSESVILTQNNIVWATYAFVSFKLALDGGRLTAKAGRAVRGEAQPAPA